MLLWLEPVMGLTDKGDLTGSPTKELLAIASEYREKLLQQRTLFKQGKRVRMITARKTK